MSFNKRDSTSYELKIKKNTLIFLQVSTRVDTSIRNAYQTSFYIRRIILCKLRNFAKYREISVICMLYSGKKRVF